MICAINSIYCSTINDIDFNVSNKEIKFDLTLNENGNISHHIMQFKNVTSFLWIEKPKDSPIYSFPDCDYYELTSIIFEKIDTVYSSGNVDPSGDCFSLRRDTNLFCRVNGYDP